MRRELIQPDSSSLTIDDAFRFRHLLIRDAAYAALPKAERVELHEALPTWLERTADQRVGEYQAILGHHLEQACRLRHELGLVADELDIERARRGAMWLAEPRTVPLTRVTTAPAPDSCGGRPPSLPTGGPERAERLVELGCALRRAGELADAEAVLSEAVDVTTDAVDRCLHGRALLERMTVHVYAGSELGPADDLATAWAPVFAESGDDRGLRSHSGFKDGFGWSAAGRRMRIAAGNWHGATLGVVGTHGWRSTAWEACESRSTSAPLQRRSPSA